MCAPVARLEMGGGRNQADDEVSSEVSAFQREEVELAKPFLIWHVTETLWGLLLTSFKIRTQTSGRVQAVFSTSRMMIIYIG